MNYRKQMTPGLEKLKNPSPLKSQYGGFAIWKEEKDAKRKWNKRNKKIAKGKLSVDPGMPHLGMQKTPRGGWD